MLKKLFYVLHVLIMNLAWVWLVALVLFWISGFGLAYKIYGGMDLGEHSL